MASIKEIVRVGAIFEESGIIRPIWFGRRRKKHDIKEITYSWSHRIGETIYRHFAVTDGAAIYELIYNSSDNTWFLSEMPVSE